MTLIEDYFSIGVNRAFYLIDTSVLLWQDTSLWNTEYHKLHNTQSIKVARDIADPRRLYYNFLLKGGPFKFENKTHVLNGRGSTGPLAVQLAVAMGCRPIILIGMDCKIGEDGRTDFYGKNVHWMPHTLSSCEKGLQFLKEQCPVEIISCGFSEHWKHTPLEEVLDQIGNSGKHGRQFYAKKLLHLT